MKKEFVNPTMRFSFFSRENIVTDSGDLNKVLAEDAIAEAAGGSDKVSITTISVKDLTLAL